MQKIPVILVSDFEESPPVTMRYALRDNEIDLKEVYIKVNRLCDHPGRGRLKSVGGGAEPDLILQACSGEFRELFMDCCSSISDYFADFMHADSVAMQSVWFHLLDKLQVAAILPHYYWLPGEPSCDHAEAFEKDFAHFKENLNVLTSPRPDASLEPVISASHLTDARHNLSHMGNKEGLKRWQQFLYKGSPGFAVPETDRVYSNVGLGSVSNSKGAVEFEAHIPWVGLALIDRHTARLRKGVEATLEDEPDAVVKASTLAEFDSKTLDWKRTSARSTIDGRRILLEPMHPRPEAANAPQRRKTLADPTSHQRNPSYNKDPDFFQYRNLNENFEMLGYHYLSDQSLPSPIDKAVYYDMFEDWADVGQD
ncbi:hypothetical protein GRF29_1g1541324 [Pseudopithomyces chartarum]|uniref:Uncharacterized protein n=1 Tax=Pseudopithomyces chartarum TaxID=1892770 RepID=A0AAN6M702_9PLEO|nr:hypothetical protein GRF29_1g1541324 [Pseudopithomyces chartarum]